MEALLETPIDDLPGRDDEARLIELARHDRRAFAELYRRNYGAVAGYLFRRTGCRHATEDLTSEVFVIALRRIERFEQRGVPLRAWLYRLATNVANRWAKAARRLRLVEESRRGAEDAGPVRAWRPDEEHDVQWEQTQAAFLRLAPQHQTVLALHYLEGLSIEQTAAVAGCRPGTVKSRLSRARDALRKELQTRRQQR